MTALRIQGRGSTIARVKIGAHHNLAIALTTIVVCVGCGNDDKSAPSKTTTTQAAATTAGSVLGSTLGSTQAPIAKPEAKPKPSPLKTSPPKTTPSASPTAVASAAASAATSAAPAVESILASIAKAGKLKIAYAKGQTAELTSAVEIDKLMAAIDTKQTASDNCPRCIPQINITFSDKFGTRLGSMGLFCGAPDDSPIAAIRDALANNCQSITMKDPDVVRKIIDAAKK